MDNEKQKQEVIDFLENTYTGAKMMGDEEVMLRASRALLAFISTCPATEENIEILQRLGVAVNIIIDDNGKYGIEIGCGYETMNYFFRI